MDIVKSANLALRFLLELAALVALGYWGYSVGRGTVMKLLLGLGVPLVVIVIWATFVAPKSAMTLPGPVTFVLGLIILGLAALSLASLGHVTLALVFGLVVLLNAALMAIWKQ